MNLLQNSILTSLLRLLKKKVEEKFEVADSEENDDEDE